jgi:hypothetical protein
MERLHSELKRSIEQNETAQVLLRVCMMLAAVATVAGAGSVLLLVKGSRPIDSANTAAQQGAPHGHTQARITQRRSIGAQVQSDGASTAYAHGGHPTRGGGRRRLPVPGLDRRPTKAVAVKKRYRGNGT